MKNCLLKKLSESKMLGRISRTDNGEPPEKAEGPGMMNSLSLDKGSSFSGSKGYWFFCVCVFCWQ